MPRCLILIVAMVVLAGCGSGASESFEAGEVTDTASDNAWRELHLAEGRAVYEAFCASCHDPGTSDAPAIGARQDWDDRSRLWTAVLSEHAKSGYLKMPVKGGAAQLSDKEVGAAAEYIVSVTYSELPVD